MESPKRSLVKTLSYRALGATLTVALVLIVTRDFAMAGLLGGLDIVVKLVGYYVHERAWSRVAWGKIDVHAATLDKRNAVAEVDRSGARAVWDAPSSFLLTSNTGNAN